MDKILVAVSQVAVTQAEHAIEACFRCCPDSAVPFASVLHSFRSYHADAVQYIIPVLARCPTCHNEIHEITLVKPKQKPSGYAAV
jgi:hypothetical protein